MPSDIFVIMFHDGTVEQLAYQEGGRRWHDILNHVYLVSSCGTKTPKRLFRNGELVCDDLSTMAYKYGSESSQARVAAQNAVNDRYPTPWKEKTP